MKAIIYARFSSDKQSHSFSIEEQIDACTQKAKVAGYEIAKAFEERAESARTRNRPVLTEMLAYISKNPTDALFIYDVSRLSRNTLDFAILKKELSEHGVSLHSVNGVPNDSLEGDLIQDVLSRVSQYQSDLSAAKIKGGMYRRFKEGYALRPVAGYIMQNNESGRPLLVPDDTFTIIQETWRRIATLKLTEKEALAFINKQMPTKKMTKSTLSRLLENKIYYGVLSYPAYNEEAVGKHQPMISEALYWQVREIISGRSPQSKKSRSRLNENYPLTKSLHCPKCNGNITAARSKGKNNYYDYYFCRNRRECKYNVQVKDIHSAFIAFLETIRPSKEMMVFMAELMKERYEARYNTLSQSTDWVDSEITKQLTKKKKATELLLDGTLDKNSFKQVELQVNHELIGLRSLLSEKKLDKLDIETVMNFVTFYMRNIHKIWERFPIQVRISVQSSTLPEGLTIENGVCRTPLIGAAFERTKEFEKTYSNNKSLSSDPSGNRTRDFRDESPTS